MLLPQQRRSHRKTNKNCGLWEIKEFVILGRHHCEKEIRKRMRHVELCTLHTKKKKKKSEYETTQQLIWELIYLF